MITEDESFSGLIFRQIQDLTLIIMVMMMMISITTVEPLYNEVLGTMKITLCYQVFRYIRVKKHKEI